MITSKASTARPYNGFLIHHFCICGLHQHVIRLHLIGEKIQLIKDGESDRSLEDCEVREDEEEHVSCVNSNTTGMARGR